MSRVARSWQWLATLFGYRLRPDADSPFDAGRAAQWSLPATGFAGLASAFLEPDPAIERDDERLAVVRAQLQALVLDPQAEPA
jgi:hypothetical protein